MTRSRGVFGCVALAGVLAVAAPGRADAQAGAGQAQQQSQQQRPPAKPEEQKPEEQQPPTYEETVVVTASKVETALVNAPATVSVISAETIQASPTQTYAELLRAVPGTNVSQTSARDINITSRGATSTLSTSQLALLDGRSLYLDFFGFVAWDFLPVNLNEVKQIEVVRGPASAVWGANALTGVVNIITKSPREMQGESLTIGAGGFNRSVPGNDLKTGTLWYVNGTYADAPNDRWSYKVSAGGYSHDAFARPVGTVPNDFNTPYPPFPNSGTAQPKLDARVDYDAEDGSRLVMAGGFAGTSGIIHTGIGPFDIQSGSVLGYGRAAWTKGPLRVSGFVNILDGNAPALLSVDATTGQPVEFSFKTQTYDLEFGNVQTVGTSNVISYGANVRRNNFDLSIAPRGDNRNEIGGYIQDEIFFGSHFRWLVGARVDKFSVLKDAVFSPRTTFMIKPAPNQTFRVSYNRAYRAPSLTNNFLDLTIVNQINLGLINPLLNGILYNFPVRAVGNEDLVETSLNAYEIGYTGEIGTRTTVSAAFYVNDTKNDIFFTQSASYTSANPPPGWPLPPIVLDILIAQGAFGDGCAPAPGCGLPSGYTYLNLGKVRDKGVELGLNVAVNRNVSAFANYSYQADPVPTGFDVSELNLPANNRFNVGILLDYDRFLGDFSVNYTDDAYWQDVLDARYHGPTKAFTLVNGGFGVRFAERKVTATIKVNNLFNVEAQQHVFGDILKRQIAGELKFQF